MEVKNYAERDVMELDRVGGYYYRHVSALTREALHAKSDIAAELAWRDSQLDALRTQLSAAEARLVKARKWMQHQPGCNSMDHDDNESCGCGLQAFLDLVGAP